MDQGTDYHFRETMGDSDVSPLFFVFHGTGGDEFQFPELARHLIPDAHVISPRGDISELGALRFFRRTSEGVYDMDDLARRTEKMARFIADQRQRTERNTVIALGYSNGANILASVLFSRPELIERAILLHPLIPFDPPDQPGLAGRSILITAGRHDPICPPPATEALIAYFERQDAQVEAVWHEGGHELRQVELDAAEAFAKPLALT